LRNLLESGRISFESGITTRKQAFDRIGELLAEATGVPAPEIARVLGEREQLGTTGFGGGTAIPHGRLAGVDRMHVAILRLQNPVDWQAMDGVPVDLLVALIGPDRASADYLKALALISRTLREESMLRKLRGAADSAALWALVADREKAAA